MIDDHITEWFGLPVEDYTPDAEYGGKIHRFAFSYDEEADPTVALASYLSDPRAASIKAIVLGMPGDAGDSFDAMINLLVEHAPKLNALRGIFVGDILQEENEMSWIEQGDVSLLLAAFPDLEELRVRGGSHLEFNPCGHTALKRLIIETGGMPASVLQNISRSSFPNLEHLELWLGTDEYGWTGSLADVKPLLESDQFPSLKSLGIRNSEIANELAETLATAPILDRLEFLDLSGGTMTDEGAEFLIASSKVRGLNGLNLFRNYLTESTIPRLSALGPKVNADGQEDPDDWDGEPHYYVAVGE